MITNKTFTTWDYSRKPSKLKEVPFDKLSSKQQQKELFKFMIHKGDADGYPYDRERSTQGQVNVANVANVVLSGLIVKLLKKGMLTLEEVDDVMTDAYFTSED